MFGWMKRPMAALALCAVLLSACLFLCACGKEEEITPMQMDILKIGKADCILINTGSKIVMIDTGEEDDLTEICAYMRQNERTKIDTLILTHYDKDHIGAAKGVLSLYEVGTVIENRMKSGSSEYIAYHGVISDKEIPVMKLTENYTFTSDSCVFTVDVPKKDDYPTKHDNNISLIVSVRCGKTDFLLCGDAMEARLQEWMTDCPEKFDFVKLPYHGSYIKNYSDFLDSVQPQYAAITCSKKNPADSETLSLLKERSIEIYQTQNGTVRVQTDGKTITVS